MALAKHERVARWDSAGVLTMPDGKLVILGTVFHNGTLDSAQDFLLAGFSGKGQPDLAFGHKSIAMTEYPGKRITTTAGALTPDGKIILAGCCRAGSTPILARMAGCIST